MILFLLGAKSINLFFLALEIASTFLHCDRNWLLP